MDLTAACGAWGLWAESAAELHIALTVSARLGLLALFPHLHLHHKHDAVSTHFNTQ